MKKILVFLILIFNLNTTAFSKNDLYEKIDLFGEVLENIKKDYVDEVDQSEIMDSAINGVYSLWIHIPPICQLNYLKKCKLIQKVNLVV